MNAKKCKAARRAVRRQGGDPKQATGATGIAGFNFSELPDKVRTLKLNPSCGRYWYKKYCKPQEQQNDNRN